MHDTPRRRLAMLEQAVETTPEDLVAALSNADQVNAVKPDGQKEDDEYVDVAISSELVITRATLRAVAAWVKPDPPRVTLLLDDRMLIAYQGPRRKMAWDVDGAPATKTYLRVCPLDGDASDRALRREPRENERSQE